MGAALLPRSDHFANASGLLREGAAFAGKYVILRCLGKGGMGAVYEARHCRLGRRVALKVLNADLCEYPELVTRFEREGRTAAALASRHAVRIVDIDVSEDATPFIVMELLQGHDLAQILAREGAQPIGRAVRWIIQACEAIGEAHELGVAHRDVKPANLFLTPAGIKVLDFGIAKRLTPSDPFLTEGATPLGTPQYMSPEQVRCSPRIDARTDIWSLGVTLFELMTGWTPFAHESPSACLAAIVADPVPDPRAYADLPDDLAEVILRCLAKAPSERYATVAELVEALMPHADPDLCPEEDEAEHHRVPPAISGTMRVAGARRPIFATKHGTVRSLAWSVGSAARRGRRRAAASVGGIVAALAAVACLSTLPKCVRSAHERDAGAAVTAAAVVAPPRAPVTAPAAQVASALTVVSLPLDEPVSAPPSPSPSPAARLPAPQLAHGRAPSKRPVVLAPAKRSSSPANARLQRSLTKPGF